MLSGAHPYTMGNHDQADVVRRRRSLGSQPAEPGVADRHASHLAAAAPPAARRRRPAVTAAFVAGVILGGTGLAAAVPGALPTQAASVASRAAKVVNPADDDGPKSPAQVAAKAAKAQARATAKAARLAAKLANGQGVARYYGPECTGFTAPYTYNHGQYVKAHPDDAGTAPNERQLAAESRCGKPVQAGTNTADAGADADKGKPKTSGKSGDANKPADAGKPASPGKSDATRPPKTSEAPESPGKAEDNRPEGAGPPSSTGS